jgi:hypothetical protein
VKRLGLALASALFLIAAGVLYGSRSGAARQPLRFSHAAHVKEAKCSACHRYYEKQASAGMPRLADCLDCHEGTQAKEPEDVKEEEKLAQYAEKRTEIRWVRLYQVPDHSFFSHRRHVVLGKLECKTCHGPIAASNAPPEKPAQPVTMDWCVSCHRKMNVTTDCNACHR